MQVSSPPCSPEYSPERPDLSSSQTTSMHSWKPMTSKGVSHFLDSSTLVLLIRSVAPLPFVFRKKWDSDWKPLSKTCHHIRLYDRTLIFIGWPPRGALILGIGPSSSMHVKLGWGPALTTSVLKMYGDESGPFHGGCGRFGFLPAIRLATVPPPADSGNLCIVLYSLPDFRWHSWPSPTRSPVTVTHVQASQSLTFWHLWQQASMDGTWGTCMLCSET
mmetsp:Transcript_75020/g.219639  ORF Transcript_75020/g.219639 Transcript_75020/m.219639 type:complete len:218 (-) Transcript_75020:104-757(-)